MDQLDAITVSNELRAAGYVLYASRVRYGTMSRGELGELSVALCAAGESRLATIVGRLAHPSPAALAMAV